ncbi:ArsR family transcriptional regulator [Sinomonas mesophila]|uniref:arsenate reductase/protein-tyrosine-phosphatase family protein n=1 Tax=Sinomonas mesophila TaxID=1531955 RepID=UPI0009870A5A|nr:ArsR family transcriptional regulator [Sinomonas mesophila]
MDIEQTPGFRERVAKHAALADAGRLRIVDLLTVGDLSPTELQAELGMPSNLLSHHLRTLEGAGLVTRHRSEGDRRRSYLRLADGALHGLVPGIGHDARRVVFVCTANSARSQLATALWSRASAIPSASAGTHPAERIAAGATAVARRHGLSLGKSSPRRLDEVLGQGDFIVTVCDNAHEELAGLGRVHWSVPDPVRRGTDEAFEHAYEDLSRRVGDLAGRLSVA